MGKRRIGIGVGVAALLVALLVWRCRERDTTDASATSSTPGAGAAAAVGNPRTGHEVAKRPDPQTQPRGSISGVVRDVAKAPIAGARVCLGGHAPQLPPDVLRERICKETDARGAFEFRDLLAASYGVTAGAKGYRPASFAPKGNRHERSFDLAAGEHKTNVDLVLRPGGAELHGTVSDISGGPIAHARVFATAGRWGDGESTPTVETDDKGAYTLWSVPGSARVMASADGYAPTTAFGTAPGKVDLLLTPESGLSGTVVDAATGRPVEGVDVAATASEWSWDGSSGDRTDAQGAFHIHRIPPGRYVVSARTDRGYGRTEGSILVGLGQQVDGVVVKLFPAARLVGKVMIDGTPPTLCIESSVWFHDEVHDRWVDGVTEPDGTVHADGVLPGTYTPQVQCEGYREKAKYPPLVVEGTDLVDLVWAVEASSTIRGHVVTKAGTPIEDARISARTIGDARAKMRWGADRSQADGTYELTGLSPGTYRVEVETSKAVAPREGFKVEVPAAGTVDKELVLEDGGAIHGLVVDDKAKPVEGVEIDAHELTDQTWWNSDRPRSAEDGTFAIEATRAGAYRVTARRGWADELRKPGTSDDDEQGEKVTVEIGKIANVRLVVETQSGTIRGTVVDAAGQPVADAFIASARESDAAGANGAGVQATRGWGWGDEDRPVLTGPDGAFVVTKLSPGTYTLRAYRKGGGEAISEHVAVGSTARLQIKSTGSIEGTARRAAGPAPAQVSVQIAELKTGFSRTETYYRTEGRFEVRDLPAGHFVVTVSAEGGQRKLDVDLAEGQHKTGLDFVLEELIDLVGRVVDLATKQPVPGMMMFAVPASSGGGFAVNFSGDDLDNISDASGKFLVKRAPKGKLMIQGMAKEWKDSPYSWVRTMRTVDGTGTIDLGDIGVIKKRINDGETPGKLGLHFKEAQPGQPPEEGKLVVSFVEPNSPAAHTEIKPGDELVTIDGVDVRGANSAYGWTLMNAPVGTKLVLVLARGPQIEVTLGPP